MNCMKQKGIMCLQLSRKTARDPKSSIESLAKALMIRPTKAFPPAVNSAI